MLRNKVILYHVHINELKWLSTLFIDRVNVRVFLQIIVNNNHGVCTHLVHHSRTGIYGLCLIREWPISYRGIEEVPNQVRQEYKFVCLNYFKVNFAWSNIRLIFKIVFYIVNQGSLRPSKTQEVSMITRRQKQADHSVRPIQRAWRACGPFTKRSPLLQQEEPELNLEWAIRQWERS